ncbi:hypothetical protein LTS12_015466 [Elasticomyces elasticus]|nr:hypothetical protein LTS12_015466 [Elasticomyces elasticus]
MGHKDARNNKPGSNKPLLFGAPATLVMRPSEELHDQTGDACKMLVYGNNYSPCVSDTVYTNVYFDKDNIAFKSYNGRQLRCNVIIIADNQLSTMHNDYTSEQLFTYIYRMILDEAHQWRNYEKIKATPIVNRLEDFCGHLAFCPKHGAWSQEVEYNEMLNLTDRDERWINARAYYDELPQTDAIRRG